MSTYVPAESLARIQAAAAEGERRRHRRKADRAQLAAARRIGLQRRHRIKRGRQSVTRELVQPPIPEVEAALPKTDFEKHFRLADHHLQSSALNLRKLRHLPAAREALKAVRHAQNLLMDAEDAP